MITWSLSIFREDIDKVCDADINFFVLHCIALQYGHKAILNINNNELNSLYAYYTVRLNQTHCTFI